MRSNPTCNVEEKGGEGVLQSDHTQGTALEETAFRSGAGAVAGADTSVSAPIFFQTTVLHCVC